MLTLKKITWLLLCGTIASCSGGGHSNTAGGPTVSLAVCPSGELFTASPVNPDSIVGIAPLGNLNPSAHTLPTDHIYFYLKADPNDSKKTAVTNIYSPGAVTITSVTASEHVTDGYTDYTIYFYPCSGVRTYLGHVQTLTDNLITQIGSFDGLSCQDYMSGGKEYKNCGKTTDIKLAAGDPIGTVGGRSYPGAFDFGMYDARVTPLIYANPDRVTASSDGIDGYHVACPLDYFDSTTKTSLESLLGSYDGLKKRTASPICGEVAQDVAGTAQGVWYLVSDNATAMALVHDNTDPTEPVFSLGAVISGLAVNTYSYTPVSSGLVNRDFKNITSDGSIYCIESATFGKIILLQLTSATTLTMDSQTASSCGAGPWSFSSTASFFER